jgi:glutamine phosphoribosylpyrophosphate amidotransferase
MKTHAIHWKSTVSGKIGTGTRLFEKEEAERLATELNEDYPGIDHDAVIPVPASAEPAAAEAA